MYTHVLIHTCTHMYSHTHSLIHTHTPFSHTHTHTHTHTHPQQGSPKNDGFVVTQFHLTEWPPRQVPNTGTLIEMLDMVTKNQMSTGNRPITVMCKYVSFYIIP
jgi:hypothetical protein